MKKVYLKPKAAGPVRRRHPWIFSGAVAKVESGPDPGDVVSVHDASGEFLAWGLYSPASRIRVRLLDWSPAAIIDDEWWRTGIAAALERRRPLQVRPELTAYRLIFAESDFLPGLIVDWYDGYAAIQALNPGIDCRKRILADMLTELTGALGVYERSEAEARRLEGLEPSAGSLTGQAPSGPIGIREGGFRFLVDVARGQKTGFYLDQRTNRGIVASYAADRNVLDCFAYTSGFSVYAAGASAASITRVEGSADASALGQNNMEANHAGSRPGEAITGDVFKVLRGLRDQGRSFDLIILDPPKFAPTKIHVPKAARAYKDINLLAVKLLEPGGILATFSCSQGLTDQLFQKIVFDAGLDANRDIHILERLSQGRDHPILLSFPESGYLKGLICQVL